MAMLTSTSVAILYILGSSKVYYFYMQNSNHTITGPYSDLQGLQKVFMPLDLFHILCYGPILKWIKHFYFAIYTQYLNVKAKRVYLFFLQIKKTALFT